MTSIMIKLRKQQIEIQSELSTILKNWRILKWKLVADLHHWCYLTTWWHGWTVYWSNTKWIELPMKYRGRGTSNNNHGLKPASWNFVTRKIPKYLRPCTHWHFYPTRVPFANGSRRVARVHTASTASGSSGTLRPHQEVFAVDANGSRRVGSAVWMLEWTRRTHRVGSDAPYAHVCRLTYLFPLIQFTWPGKVTYVMS